MSAPDRFRLHRVRAAARRRRCPPGWPEAGRGATPRGRRRAASARRPSRARPRGRNCPRRPVRGRARVPASRAAARLGRIQRSRDFPPRRAPDSRADPPLVVSAAVDSVVAIRSRHRRMSHDRRPIRGPRRGRTRSRGLAERSRRVACEPSPPVRPWSWSRSRFSARTAGSAAVRFAWVGIGRNARSCAWSPWRTGRPAGASAAGVEREGSTAPGAASAARAGVCRLCMTRPLLQR